MTVFDVFKSTPYIFLEITKGTVRGDLINQHTGLSGVFKQRSGVTASNNIQVTDSTATLHVKPVDFIDFTSTNMFVGHGVRVNGVSYQIVGATAGMNFDTDTLEHYTLTLERADYGDYYGEAQE